MMMEGEEQMYYFFSYAVQSALNATFRCPCYSHAFLLHFLCPNGFSKQYAIHVFGTMVKSTLPK